MLRTFSLVAVLLLAACAGTDGDRDLGSDPDRVLLTVTSEGGFIPPEFNLERMPRYVLMGDGTLYYQGPVIMIFPGPLLPNVRVTSVSEARLGEILDLVDDLGLPEIDEVVDNTGAEMVADADTTFVTYYDSAGGAHRLGVYALGFVDGPSSVTRLLVTELIEELDLAVEEGPDDDYEPQRLQVAAGPAIEFDPGMSVERPWPLEIGFEEMPDWGIGWRCTEITGSTVASLMSTFADANQASHWVDGNGVYSIKARPLLPGEDACAGGFS